jgi:alpha-galactosidase
MKKATLLILILIGWSSIVFAQKDRSLALTPPMGWNSWNTFASNINETLIKEMADAMVSSGMRDAGYKYLVIDDCWLAPERDSLQNLQADPKKFPHGMKALGDYIHSKGLKFGIYNCAGTKTCAGFPGTRGHEYQDALLYASWGVDYLKYDWCNTDGINAKEAYTTMSKALEATHRPIVFSLCEWGNNQPWLWAEPVGQLWRATGDIGCSWYNQPHTDGSWTPNGIIQIINLVAPLRQYAGPGHWNDPDMLEVGNGLPVNEDRAHFSMWAMLAAPLIAGNDLRNMSEETKAILTNRGVIAVDQDSLGIQGLRYEIKDSVQTWMKPLKGGDWAVCFLNTASQPQAIDFDWKANVVKDSLSNAELNANAQPYVIEDLWTNKTLGNTDKTLKATVPSHDVLMIYLSKQQKAVSKKKHR